MATQLKHAAATGSLITGAGVLKGVTLAGGSAASTVALRDATDDTPDPILTLAAVTGTTATWITGDERGVPFVAGIHATLSGTGAAVTVEVE